jgi:hypothetical protein
MRQPDLEAHIEYYRVLADEAFKAGPQKGDENGSLLSWC